MSKHVRQVKQKYFGGGFSIAGFMFLLLGLCARGFPFLWVGAF